MFVSAAQDSPYTIGVVESNNGNGNSRRIIDPGHFEQSGAVWVDTDVSGEDAAVQALATTLWTAPVKAAWKVLQTAQLPPAPSAEQLRIAAYRADPTRANLLTLIQGSTPAQVNTWLTNNVTTLPQARAVLGQIILLIGGASVS